MRISSSLPKFSILCPTNPLITHVLLFPPREFCSRYVSFEFRYGTCESLLASAMITLPRLLKLLLMFLVSLNLSPWEPDWESRSEPAKSIRFKVPEDKKCLWLQVYIPLYSISISVMLHASLVPRIPDLFNMHEKRGRAWDLMTCDKHWHDIM